MANPLVDQGVLNRLQASVTWAADSTLNITPSFLGKMGIRLAIEGNATDYIDTMTGAVASPVPYMKASMTLHLLKSQGLSNIYKARMELASRIGDGLVYPDVPPGVGLGIYAFTNCSIQNVREINLDGTDADYAISIAGYYLINSSLWL